MVVVQQQQEDVEEQLEMARVAMMTTACTMTEQQGAAPPARARLLHDGRYLGIAIRPRSPPKPKSGQKPQESAAAILLYL